jgi:hypothetical protein
MNVDRPITRSVQIERKSVMPVSPHLVELVPLDRLRAALIKATGSDQWGTALAELLGGGKSNLTFLLRGGERNW